MFSSIEDVVESFGRHNYIASRRIATVVYLAAAMKKPILVEGPAGVGKTDLAKVLAASLAEVQRVRLDLLVTWPEPLRLGGLVGPCGENPLRELKMRPLPQDTRCLQNSYLEEGALES